MKVAIIQEWLVTVGGSDKVVKAIADVFPNADIYTLVAKKKSVMNLELSGIKCTHPLSKGCHLAPRNTEYIYHYFHLP